MKKYFTVNNILLLAFVVAAFAIAVFRPVPDLLAISYAGALVIGAIGFVVFASKSRDVIAGLNEQLDEVRKSRDGYMSLYKEYSDKYTYMSKRCARLESDIADLTEANHKLELLHDTVPAVAASKPEKKTMAKKSTAAIKAELQDVTANLKKKKKN